MVDRLRNRSAQRIEGCREGRRCSRDTYPESYITEYTSVYEDQYPFLMVKSAASPVSFL